jgi:RNA polymerase sigma-70 factor (ECF subfamily)
MPEERDGVLASLARDGDEEAIDVLVRRHLPAVLTLTQRITGDRALGEDAAQETFVKAWRNLSKYDDAKPFRPWVLQIARNTSLDLLRKRRNTTFTALSGDDGAQQFEDTLADEEPLPDEVFERKELAAEVGSALAQLPERDRSVLTLRYEDQLPFEEIADVMSAPMNTVKSWHRRALAKMRAILTLRSAPNHD